MAPSRRRDIEDRMPESPRIALCRRASALDTPVSTTVSRPSSGDSDASTGRIERRRGERNTHRVVRASRPTAINAVISAEMS